MRCMHIKIVMSFWRIEPFIITYSKVAQSGLTLRDPIDCSPPGSSVRGMLQARILEWVAMPSSRGSSRLRDQTYLSYVSCIGWQAGSLP